jgi:aspartyl-tRNA(Asn)/glutamyl-tRNA(Gln) amidotransferase subunit C
LPVEHHCGRSPRLPNGLNSQRDSDILATMAGRISEDQVRHVARLSRLELTDEQVGHFTTQLSAILDYVSKLEELDVDDVEPMAHALDVTNVLRPDEVIPPMPLDEALANAPDKSPPFFKVPKVLGDDSGA